MTTRQTPAQIALRRAFAAAKRIPNAPDPKRAQRIHAWAEFVKGAMKDEDKDEGREREALK